MFNPEAIKKFIDNKENFECIQKKAADPASPNHLQAMLQLGIYKVYTTKIYEDLIGGFEKICEVALLGKEHTANAHNVMDFTELPEDSLALQLIFKHYNSLPQKTDRTQTILGLCHEKGIGSPINLNNALRCYELAAENSYAPARYNLGVHEEQYSREQMTYFEAAANQKYPPAQNKCGVFYTALQEHETAKEFYESAAEQGYAPAQNNLALYYESIKENASTVIQLYKSAIAQGHEEAQRNLHRYLAQDNASVDSLFTPQRNAYTSRKNPIIITETSPVQKKTARCCAIL
jgi:TPR repeat protein